MFTEKIPAASNLSMDSLLKGSSLCTKISPVSLSITSSAARLPIILFSRLSFLLNLYLPTFARSYLFGSKNKELINDEALSNVGGSPGLNLLYISINASSELAVLSFSSVFKSCSVSPNVSIICELEESPIALTSTVAGSFLVRSTLTYIISLESVSYSSHAPLFGISVDSYSSLPTLSLVML